MCVQNKLAKILLLITPVILGACSAGDGASSPSLSADAIWDQMAEERQEPLTQDWETDDSDEIWAEMPFVTSIGPLSAEDIDIYRITLLAAEGKYQTIISALDEVFVTLGQKTLTEEDRYTQNRTAQLYLSRLINLYKNMDRAVAALGDEDQILKEKNRDLLIQMAKNIIHNRNMLDGNN